MSFVRFEIPFMLKFTYISKKRCPRAGTGYRYRYIDFLPLNYNGIGHLFIFDFLYPAPPLVQDPARWQLVSTEQQDFTTSGTDATIAGAVATTTSRVPAGNAVSLDHNYSKVKQIFWLK